MNKKIKTELTDKLFECILSMETIEECYQLFEDLCTVPEMKAMAQRAAVAKLLYDKTVYNDIVDVSDNFKMKFENSGIMINGKIYTANVMPKLSAPKVLNEIIEKEKLSEDYKIALDNRMSLSLIEAGITIVNSNYKVYKNIRSILTSDEYKSACKKLTLKYFPIHWKTFFWNAKIKCTFMIYVLLIFMCRLASKK